MSKDMTKVKLNITISKELKDELKQLCEDEHRKCSQQIVVMFEFYKKYRYKVNNKVK